MRAARVLVALSDNGDASPPSSVLTQAIEVDITRPVQCCGRALPLFLNSLSALLRAAGDCLRIEKRENVCFARRN